jgi:hypothetical protein
MRKAGHQGNNGTVSDSFEENIQRNIAIEVRRAPKQ